MWQQDLGCDHIRHIFLSHIRTWGSVLPDSSAVSVSVSPYSNSRFGDSMELCGEKNKHPHDRVHQTPSHLGISSSQISWHSVTNRYFNILQPRHILQHLLLCVSQTYTLHLHTPPTHTQLLHFPYIRPVSVCDCISGRHESFAFYTQILSLHSLCLTQSRRRWCVSKGVRGGKEVAGLSVAPFKSRLTSASSQGSLLALTLASPCD